MRFGVRGICKIQGRLLMMRGCIQCAPRISGLLKPTTTYKQKLGLRSKTPRKKCRALPPARWDLAVAAKKKRSSTPASHCCAEIPAGIPAGIPQLTGRLQKNLVLCPAVPAPKGTVAVRAAGPLYIYIYIYIPVLARTGKL